MIARLGWESGDPLGPHLAIQKRWQFDWMGQLGFVREISSHLGNRGRLNMKGGKDSGRRTVDSRKFKMWIFKISYQSLCRKGRI